MENRVYYGEYSLIHWIDLILKENIILPEYQRYFVWKEEDVSKFIDTLKDRQFVPPVIIGTFQKGEEKQNLIIDGQQKLTSILLVYLELFPKKEIFKEKMDRFADENDDGVIDEDLDDNILNWTFKSLLKEGKNKQSIINKIGNNGKYKKLDCGVDEKFFNTTFLGFSYLVPDTNENKAQQKYYSSVFRSINKEGIKLSAQESRESLYYLDSSLTKLLNPDFYKSITIKNLGTDNKSDFVRYLSLLSQYDKDGNTNSIGSGYSGKKMENYYEDYIYSIVGEKNSTNFNSFSVIFPEKNYETQLNLLRKTINLLEIPKQYPSIIDSDLYLFGLIYKTVIKNKEIDNTKKEVLKKEIDDKIKNIKDDERNHTKAPSALKYIRYRMESSIEIYNKYANE